YRQTSLLPTDAVHAHVELTRTRNVVPVCRKGWDQIIRHMIFRYRSTDAVSPKVCRTVDSARRATLSNASGGMLKIARTASAIDSGELSARRKPFTPSSMTSGIAPTPAARTG